MPALGTLRENPIELDSDSEPLEIDGTYTGNTDISTVCVPKMEYVLKQYSQCRNLLPNVSW